jgi:nitroimidazol reductase NimA-like FMN-containing flavoprotein (pyridoxamine 5'-phosphate oxidase superfamily)
VEYGTVVSTDHAGLQVIPEDECLRLLAGATLGRVALSIAALPVVLPVNFAVDHGDVILRTGSGTKLDAALAGSVVAFEVDDYDPVYHTGWSVLFTGIANVVTLHPELDRLKQLPLRPWAPGERDHYVRIAKHAVSGRRIGDPVLRRRHSSHP